VDVKGEYDANDNCRWYAYGNCSILEPNFAPDPDGKSDYANPYLFTGRRLDILDNSSLKIQYNRNRYYDYYTGRFTTHDPLGINPARGTHNLLGINSQYKDDLNLYEYVKCNPVVNNDAFGLITAKGIFIEILHRWIVGNGALYVKSGEWADFVKTSPLIYSEDAKRIFDGLDATASFLLREKAMEICRSNQTISTGVYVCRRRINFGRDDWVHWVLFYKDDWYLNVTLNAADYMITGQYQQDQCRRNIFMKQNKHYIFDIVAPRGGQDFIMYAASVLGILDDWDWKNYAFMFFPLEIRWKEDEYIFQMDPEYCTIKQQSGSWPF